MSDSSEVVGEVIVRVKPVLDESELGRVVEQAGAAVSAATNTAGRANATAGAASTRAALAGQSAAMPTPKGVEGMFTRGAITNRLINEMRPHIDEVTRGYEEMAGDVAGAFSFAQARLPSEVTRPLQGHPDAKRIRGIYSTGVSGGNAWDLINKMGEDAYHEYSEAVAGSPRSLALKTAAKLGDPTQQLLAGLAASQPYKGGLPLPPMEMINIAALPPGTKFTQNSTRGTIIEPEEGQRYLRTPFAKNDLPVEALGHIPVDIGSLKLPAPANIDAFGDGLEGFGDAAGSGRGGSGRRIPLQQYRRNQLSLPSPLSATSRFHDYYNEGRRSEEEIERSARHMQRVRKVRDRLEWQNYDPEPDISEIRRLEEQSASIKGKGKGIFQAMIDAKKAAVRKMGYDPDGPDPAPLVTPSQVMSDADRLGARPALPPPGYHQEFSPHSGRYRGGGNRGGGVGGNYGPGDFGDEPERRITRWGMQGRRRPNPADDIFEGEVVGEGPWNHWTEEEVMNHHGRGTARTRRGRSGRRKRSPFSGVGEAIDKGLDSFDRFEGRMGRRGTLLGGIGRSIVGKAFGRFLPPSIGPMTRGQHRLSRIGNAIRTLGNTPSMSFGNYMTAFFGGGEVLGSLTNISAGNALSGATGNMQDRAKVDLQTYNAATQGFFGRFAAFTFDPFGKRSAQIGVDLDVSGRMDDFLKTEREMVVGMRGAGRRGTFTEAGSSIRGMTELVAGMTKDRRAAMDAFNQKTLAIADRAAADAGAEYEAMNNAFGRTGRTKDEYVEDARIKASQGMQERRDGMSRELSKANRATIDARLADMIDNETRSTEDFRSAARNAGNPVAEQRAQLGRNIARRDRDRIAQRGDFVKKLMEEGYSEADASSRFEKQSTVDRITDQAESDAFEANVAYNVDQMSKAQARTLRIGSARRGVRSRRAGAAAEYDTATSDSVYTEAREAAIRQGMTLPQADVYAGNARSEFDQNRSSDRAYNRESITTGNAAQAAVNRLSIDNKPWDAQREAVRSRAKAEARSLADSENSGFFEQSIEDVMKNAGINDRVETEVGQIDKNERNTRGAVRLNRAGRKAVNQATMDARNGKRSRFAPGLEAMYNGYLQEYMGLVNSGMGDQTSGLLELYQGEVENVRSQFLSDFKPTQHKSLDEIDAGTLTRDGGTAKNPKYRFTPRRNGEYERTMDDINEAKSRGIAGFAESASESVSSANQEYRNFMQEKANKLYIDLNTPSFA